MRPDRRTLSDPTRRRVATADAIILFVALCLGITWASQTVPILTHLAAYDANGPFHSEQISALYSYVYHSVILRRSLHACAALFAPLCLGLLIVRFRRPRPPVRRCFRQPGTMACAAALVCTCFEVANHFLNFTVRFNTTRMSADLRMSYLLFAPPLRDASIAGGVAFSMGQTAGWVVAGAYLALCAAGVWRSEPTWLDRMGRTLGWIWMLMALAFIALPISD